MKVIRKALETLTVDLPKLLADLDRITENAGAIAVAKPNGKCKPDKEGETDGENIIRRPKKIMHA